MHIVLLGPDGQVGWELRRALAPLGQVTALTRADGGDLARPAELAAKLRSLKPDAVVNAAAYTAVDKAEGDAALAHTINADAPGAVATVMAELGGWLLHYSTDYVFDGSGDQPRDETAPTGPLSVYGRTKLAGEEAILASGCRHLILRTSWVHAARGGNFARTMLRLAAERDSLNVIDDQIGAPTGADLLADVAAHALRGAVANPSLSGTYHAVAAGETSWCQYARHVIGWARDRGVALKCGPETVNAIPTSAYPTPATRPLNSRLDTHKLRNAFGLRLPDWQAGVERMLAEALNLK
ncbi:dTDP-4-dehydrorhamnose reductase [Ideonella sp. DXS22W]|uniref:dTDP-4-dehydrorhamnose reductase n=1 Tax=Pseudaquabacterium inlustre TaxID=2984192 RepID=A0ABU9CDE7_9BURK